jgi:hypothetical protein
MHLVFIGFYSLFRNSSTSFIKKSIHSDNSCLNILVMANNSSVIIEGFDKRL